MNNSVSVAKNATISSSDFSEKEIGNNEIKSNESGTTSSPSLQTAIFSINSLSKSTSESTRSTGTNSFSLNKPPEILAPEDFSLDIMQTLRLIQIEFCSADMSQAASNARQIQEGLEEQNRKRNDKEMEITTRQESLAAKEKTSKDVGKALQIVGIIVSIVSILTIASPIGLLFAVVALVMSAWSLIADFIPEDSRATRQNIFGETVKWDYSLSGVIGVLCEMTLASPDAGIGVEGAHTDNSKKTTMLSRSEFENYKLGWSLGINLAIALPGIIYGGVQVVKSFKAAKDLITSGVNAATAIAEKFMGAETVATIARFSTAAQFFTSLTTIGLAIGKAYLAGDRRIIADKQIENFEVQRAITILEKAFERNHESFQYSMDFQEVLRKSVAAAIFKRIEPSTTIAKNIG